MCFPLPSSRNWKACFCVTLYTCDIYSVWLSKSRVDIACRLMCDPLLLVCDPLMFNISSAISSWLNSSKKEWVGMSKSYYICIYPNLKPSPTTFKTFSNLWWAVICVSAAWLTSSVIIEWESGNTNKESRIFYLDKGTDLPPAHRKTFEFAKYSSKYGNSYTSMHQESTFPLIEKNCLQFAISDERLTELTNMFQKHAMLRDKNDQIFHLLQGQEEEHLIVRSSKAHVKLKAPSLIQTLRTVEILKWPLLAILNYLTFTADLHLHRLSSSPSAENWIKINIYLLQVRPCLKTFTLHMQTPHRNSPVGRQLWAQNILTLMHWC